MTYVKLKYWSIHSNVYPGNIKKANRSSKSLQTLIMSFCGPHTARHPMHCVDLAFGADSSFFPRYRRAQQMDGDVERQTNELLKKAKIRESTSAIGHNRVLARKEDGRWRGLLNFKFLNTSALK